MERLISIQQKLRVTKDKSGDKGRFKFRSAEDILEKAKPYMEETKTAVVLSDELVDIGGRLAIKSTATLLGVSKQPECSCTIAVATGYAVYDKHEIVKRDTGEIVNTMSNEQCTGSASSYARKYALCGLFAIDNDENDPDQPEVQKAPQPKKPVAPKQESKPAPKPAPAPEPEEIELSAEEEETFLELCADIDNATEMSNLKASVALASGQRFERMIRDKANSVAIKNGWVTPK